MIDWLPSARAVVTVGDFTIYWYGVLYVIAFSGVYYMFGRLQQYRQLTLSRSQILELITWGAVGAVVGGRLGYVLLYEPAYYFAQPLEILQLSQGGMSSHGGFVGVGLVIFGFVVFPSLRRRGAPLQAEQGGLQTTTPLPHLQVGHLPSVRGGKTAYLSLLDVIAVPAALGLALGRLGNVINHELYVTPLAQVAAISLPLALAGICWWALRRWRASGKAIGLFLILYSLARFIEEFLREPEWPSIFGWFTWGQLYTVPLLLVGAFLFVYGLKDEAEDRHPTGI